MRWVHWNVIPSDLWRKQVCNLSSRLEPPGNYDVVICPEQNQKWLPTEGISARKKTSISWVSFIILKQKRCLCVAGSTCLLIFLLPLPIITSPIFCLAGFCLLVCLGGYEWVCCVYKDIWILLCKRLSIDCTGSLA